MRAAAIFVLSVFVSASLTFAQERPERIPVGVQKAMEKRRMPTEPPLPPQPRQVDPVQLKKEADELAQLAQSIPAAIEQVGKGMIPTDLSEKLKRIEKLSKRLRNELFP